MARLHIYTVHIRPDEPHPYEKAEFVEEGFNWYAFIFTFIWAFYKRLWLVGFGILAFNILIAVAAEKEWMSHFSIAAIQIGFQMALGFQANDWRRAKLKRRGYITADLVSGDNELRAEQRFYDRFAATQTVPA